MKEKKTEKTASALIPDLMRACGFGAVIAPITSVSGGFLHRMYRVETASGLYAVKHLNPEIMSRDGVHDNFERAEKIELLLEKKGIPIVPSLTVNGHKMQTIEGQYFYIFHWQEGHMTDWNHITDSQCRMAGNILGRIHAIHPENVSHQEPEIREIDWKGYICRAAGTNSEITSVLSCNEQLLDYAVQELNKARASLPDIICVSNEDMDPKNIMWDNGRPWVIDLECLDYGNPVSHALQLALQWSGITTCKIDMERLASFFEGYLEAYDNCFRAYGSVFGLAYTWVEWLEYNIRRALDTHSDDQERMMGLSEVKNTVARIRYLRDMEEEIKKALDTRLP